MKIHIVVGFIFALQCAFSQTLVSGGIYQNTTWAASGSPYLVTGSIVVFPGKTLTVEPGVEVVFTADNTFNTGNFQYLEVRGSLIAVGTDANPILFTSSDTTAGFYNWMGIRIKGSQGGTVQLDAIELRNSWYGVHNDISEPGIIYTFRNSKFISNNYALQMNADMVYENCIFRNNGVGQAAQISYGSLTALDCQFINNFCSFTWSNAINITNCLFSGNTNNIIGSPGTVQGCTFLNNDFAFAETNSMQINGCYFEGNNVGLDDSGSSIVENSVFVNNGVALKIGDNTNVNNNEITNNTVGIQVRGYNPGSTFIENNILCNNTVYNLENLTDKNFQVNLNCFCSSDSATVEDLIYDGYDDITRGLVNYALYDDSCQTILSYITKIDLGPLGIVENLEGDWKVWAKENMIFISIDYGTTLELISLSGEVIQTRHVQQGETTFQVDVEPGFYFLRDQDGRTKRLFI
ncbi:MAG: hypothetical protein RL632_1553 [Bacteroidota bacterium]|jgi:hypothetical protein